MRCKTRRRFRATPNSNHTLPVAPNPLDRPFPVAEPDRVDVGDITDVATSEGWLDSLGVSGPVLAPGGGVGDVVPARAFLVHTDRGSPYASGRFQTLLKDQGYVCSMSRKGNCWDNAPAESFFHTLKTELIHHRRFETRDKAKQAIFRSIEVF